MFDFLRDLRKSEEERRQEALTAYLDGRLTPAERRRFERLLTSDKALRASLEEQRLIKISLRRLPRMRAPRNFTLDPARYGRPAPGTAERLYPIMRVATVLVAILFVFALVIDLAPLDFGRGGTQSVAESIRPAAEMVEAPAAPEEEPAFEGEAQPAAVNEQAVEVTRIVEAEEEMVEMAAEEPAAEEPAAAEMAPEAEQPAEEAMESVGTDEVEEMLEVEAPSPGPEEASGGGGLPPEETPLAMAAPPTGDGAAAATEGEALEDRAIVEPTKSQEATIEAEESMVARDMAMTEEAADQPTATPRAISTAEADQGPAQEAARAGAPASQLLVAGLGLLLLVLIGATLLLRRRTR
jgi:anti-sigma factor RsiW